MAAARQAPSYRAGPSAQRSSQKTSSFTCCRILSQMILPAPARYALTGGSQPRRWCCHRHGLATFSGGMRLQVAGELGVTIDVDYAASSPSSASRRTGLRCSRAVAASSHWQNTLASRRLQGHSIAVALPMAPMLQTRGEDVPGATTPHEWPHLRYRVHWPRQTLNAARSLDSWKSALQGVIHRDPAARATFSARRRLQREPFHQGRAQGAQLRDWLDDCIYLGGAATCLWSRRLSPLGGASIFPPPSDPWPCQSPVPSPLGIFGRGFPPIRGFGKYAHFGPGSRLPKA